MPASSVSSKGFGAVNIVEQGSSAVTLVFESLQLEKPPGEYLWGYCLHKSIKYKSSQRMKVSKSIMMFPMCLVSD
jgi:hypothetical protein